MDIEKVTLCRPDTRNHISSTWLIRPPHSFHSSQVLLKTDERVWVARWWVTENTVKRDAAGDAWGDKSYQKQRTMCFLLPSQWVHPTSPQVPAFSHLLSLPLHRLVLPLTPQHVMWKQTELQRLHPLEHKPPYRPPWSKEAPAPGVTKIAIVHSCTNDSYHWATGIPGWIPSSRDIHSRK